MCQSEPAPTLPTCDVAGEGDLISLADVPAIDPGRVDEGVSRVMGKEASLLNAEGRMSHRFASQSLLEIDSCIDCSSVKELIDLTVNQDWGALSDPGAGASPPLPVLENEWVRFVHSVSTRIGDERVVLVGRCEVHRGMCRDVAVDVIRKCRAEAALVRQLTAELRSSRSARVVLGVSTTWLGKSLLQPQRRFRAPLLFGHVLDLHACARGRDVVLICGIPAPEPLTTAMSARFDALVREHAIRQSSPRARVL